MNISVCLLATPIWCYTQLSLMLAFSLSSGDMVSVPPPGSRIGRPLRPHEVSEGVTLFCFFWDSLPCSANPQLKKQSLRWPVVSAQNIASYLK